MQNGGVMVSGTTVHCASTKRLSRKFVGTGEIAEAACLSPVLEAVVKSEPSRLRRAAMHLVAASPTLTAYLGSADVKP